MKRRALMRLSLTRKVYCLHISTYADRIGLSVLNTASRPLEGGALVLIAS